MIYRLVVYFGVLPRVFLLIFFDLALDISVSSLIISLSFAVMSLELWGFGLGFECVWFGWRA